jgi:chemotaxis protein CheD
MQKETISTQHYFDRKFNCNAVKIGPGEFYFTDEPIAIVTVLGSCISACISDKRRGIGGMNHFMLPSIDNSSGGAASQSMRYGAYAMEVLLNELFKKGARRENLEAKIFGGGRVIRGASTLNVGESNASFIKQYLKDENIRITAEDLVDSFSRKVYFFPVTAEAFVKRMSDEDRQAVVTQETTYNKTLATKPVGGTVDLF